jgi:hypothetical protein
LSNFLDTSNLEHGRVGRPYVKTTEAERRALTMKLQNASKVGARFAGAAVALPCAMWPEYAAATAHLSAPAAAAQRKRRTAIGASVGRSNI